MSETREPGNTPPAAAPAPPPPQDDVDDTKPAAAADASGVSEPQSNSDEPKNASSAVEDENDDDYDPEQSFQESPSSSSSAAKKEAPKIEAESVIQSVLDGLQKKSASAAASSATTNSSSSVDLSKLLSTIAPQQQKVHNSRPSGTRPAQSSSSPSPPPPSSSHEPSPILPTTMRQRRESDVEKPFTEDENNSYQRFVKDEQRYVASGEFEKFPQEARLFVGNLPKQRITKAQLFKIFYKYGSIVQISMKNAYGFVQFHDNETCRRAIEGEQSIPVRGNLLQLEISKPQQPKTNKRSRSRSPTRKGKKNKRDKKGGRERSPLRYDPRSAPELQIFVLDRLDRGFVFYIEKFFKDAGISVEIDQIKPAHLQDAVNQIAYDGVLGVVSLDFTSQNTGQVSIQVFDRSSGSVRFDEYLNVTPMVAVELINRQKRDPSASSMPANNSMPSFPPQGAPQSPPNPANLLGTLQNMDPNSLQQVLGMLHQNNQQFPPQMPQMPPGQAQNFNLPPVSGPPPSTGSQPSDSGQSTQQVQNIMEQLAQLQGQVSK